MYHFAIVLGSDLEKGNQTAFDAVYHSITGIVLYFVSLIISIVASFFQVTKD
ncbi:MAG: hypothetical protein J6D37_06165 [Clostridia bacterium]|nr:hypothetical protein [Clostridia bacterium]